MHAFKEKKPKKTKNVLITGMPLAGGGSQLCHSDLDICAKKKKKKEGWGRDKETNWDLNVYEKWPDVNNDQKKEPVDAEVKAKEKRKKGSKNILLFNLINTEAR